MDDMSSIEVMHLFQPERDALLDLLRDLEAGAWDEPTACAGWTVKDVALHILGGDIGIVSRKRDEFHVPLPETDSFVDALNLHNAIWVESTRRMSPQLLIDLLEHVGRQAFSTFGSLDLTAMGGAVYWAGPEPAPVWLDVAREYTERWHHQQHIREAIGRPGLMDRRFARPVFDTFAYALPCSFRDVEAEPGALLELHITGDAGGRWRLAHSEGRWLLERAELSPASATVEMSPDIAWKMFTGGLPVDACERASTIGGDQSLARALFTTRAIIV